MFYSEIPSWKFIPSMRSIVIGYFTVRECFGREHFNYHEPKYNHLEGNTTEELIKELVLNYTHPGGNILDIAGLQGGIAT